MDLQTEFGTDKARETDGVWRDVGDGARLLIARANNPEYTAELRRLLKPHTVAVRRETIKADVLDPILTRALAVGVLKGWEGVSIGGKALKYSEENALKVMTDYPDFRALVVELSEQREAYLAEVIEEGKATSGK